MQFTEWMKQAGQKIVVTDRIMNGNRLIRKCNRELGMDTSRVTCMTLQQIATELLIAWTAMKGDQDNQGLPGHPGELEEITVLEPEAAAFVMDEILRNGSYDFLPAESRCLRTSQVILESVNQIRMNTPTEKYLYGGEHKIEELRHLIEVYEKTLQEKNKYDYPSLLQKGTEILQQMNGESEQVSFYLPWLTECSVGRLKDWEPTVLEERFFRQLMELAGITDVQLDFYLEEPQQNYSFFKAYGNVNEIRYVTDYIIDKKIPYGEVNLFYAAPEYEPFLQSTFESIGIPCRFLTGRKVASGNLVQFMLAVLDFAQEDFLYEKLQRVIVNPLTTFGNIADENNTTALKDPIHCFNRILRKGIGWGKSRYLACVEELEKDEEQREKYLYFLQFLKELMDVFSENENCGELYRKLLAFTLRYTYARSLERRTLLGLLKEQVPVLAQVVTNGPEESIRLLKEHLQSLTIRESSETNAVNIIRIQNLEVIERPYNFVIGLSAGQFQTETIESPVLADEELQTYLSGKVLLATENGKRVRENLKRSFGTCSGCRIIMGYSTFDTIELRESSPSVFYLEYWERYGKGVQQIDYCTYEQEKSHIRLKKAGAIGSTEETGPNPVEMSSSALQVLLQCPLQYYYHYMKMLPSMEFQQKNDYNWLNAAGKGNLFHRTMERYCREVVMGREEQIKGADREQFLRIYEGVIKELLAEQPYTSKSLYEQEKEEGEKQIWNYLQVFHREMQAEAEQGKKWHILGCELGFEKLSWMIEDPDGQEKPLEIQFQGSIDRLDGYLKEDGTLCLRIVDYKTGNKDKKKKEIAQNRQIQHFIYTKAALEYVRNHLEEVRQQLGGKIEKMGVESARYLFPFEESEDRMLEVSGTLIQNLQDGKIALPGEVRELLWNTLGQFANGKGEAAQQAIMEYIDATQEDVKAENLPCRYCNYTRQCRRMLGAEL